MGTNDKKVVLLIVEGNSDESLLINRLRELFEHYEIRFHIERGDIMYDLSRRTKAIKSVIGDTVKAFITKNKFRTDDIFAVLHIIDTDGCFIAEKEIIIDENQETLTVYQQAYISVASAIQKDRIAKRNDQRSSNVNSMRAIQTILPGHINYRIYYFSRNLEHVLFDEPNPKNATKVLDVEEFVESLPIPIEEFLKPFMSSASEINHDTQYVESWNHILQDTASLQRFTNVPLLFEFIQLNSNDA